MSNPTLALTILIVDDHELTRLGLSSAIKKKSKFTISGEAVDGISAVSMVEQLTPDIVLMDIGMPKMDGITATRQIKERVPGCKVIILSSRHLEDEITASIAAGADGYCLKDIATERLIQVIELVSEGGIWLDPYIAKFLAGSLTSSISRSRQVYNTELTEREKEVLTLIVEGKPNKEIAQLLGITLPTTKVHVSNLIQKLSVDDRTQAAVKAVQEGLVSKRPYLGSEYK